MAARPDGAGRRSVGRTLLSIRTNAIPKCFVEITQKLRRTLNAMKLRSASGWRPAEPM
jgi:hypothetical protein